MYFFGRWRVSAGNQRWANMLEGGVTGNMAVKYPHFDTFQTCPLWMLTRRRSRGGVGIAYRPGSYFWGHWSSSVALGSVP